MQPEQIIVRGQFSSREAVEGTFMTIRAQTTLLRSESGSLCQVDAEPIPPTLIPPRHLCGCVTQLLLDVALVDLGTGRETCAQAVPREQGEAFFFRKLTADARVENRLFDQTRDVFVRETRLKHLFVVTCRATEEGTKVDFGKVQPLIQRMHWTGLIAGSAANLNLAPACLCVKGEQCAVFQHLDPATRIWRIVLADIKADDLGSPQLARIAKEQDGSVAQRPQVVGQGGDHGENVIAQDGFLLHRWPRVFTFNPGQQRGDMPVFAIEGRTPLLVLPGETRQAALDRAHGQGSWYPVSRSWQCRGRPVPETGAGGRHHVCGTSWRNAPSPSYRPCWCSRTLLGGRNRAQYRQDDRGCPSQRHVPAGRSHRFFLDLSRRPEKY